MSKFTRIAFAALLIHIIFSCTEDDSDYINPPDYEVIILPIGDSRVAGDRPVHESYRYDLWKNLIDNNWDFDFVGSETDASEYPTYSGEIFDKEHAGVGGHTTKDVLISLESTLSVVETPDIVLLGIGGNDLVRTNSYEEAIQNINSIIDILQDHNPEVTIFLEQIAPGNSSSFSEENLELFENFQNAILTISEERSTEDSNVITVDMAMGWTDILLIDDVHYNIYGAKVVGNRYFDAIDLYFER
ncbi:SGNH/GDSL hydrolase family protein [Dokdonia ponticola]|uniref:SGNH/GDSL hydrolase family protein n=1 Tax=Dokdonia ponticola TaxID=2041041 RepID=A0ABV9HVF2_9FLAO